MPLETLALLRERDATFVRGNADRVLDFEGGDGGDRAVWKQARLWVAERLGTEALAFLAGLPLDPVLDVDSIGPVRFCHGAPGSDVETITD